MTSTEIQTALDSANCYGCYGLSIAQRLTLGLEKQWLLTLNATADTAGNVLLDSVNCLSCYGTSIFDLLETALLRNIRVAGIVSDFVQRAGITDAGQINALNTLVSSAIGNGWWDKCDLIYPFVGGTDVAHAQNLKSSSFAITWNGTVTHDANGITGDDATGFGDTTYIPSSNSIAQNSGHISIYKRTVGLTTGTAFGARSVASSTRRVAIAPSTTQTVVYLTSNFVVLSTIALGFMAISRDDTSQVSSYYGGSENIALASSTGTVDLSMYLLALHQAPGAIDFSGVNISSATAGIGLSSVELSAMAADWQTFQTALGRQV